MGKFTPGTKVKTTDSYYQKFGRRVIGEVTDTDPFKSDDLTVVRWDYQEGRIIKDHQGTEVLMMTEDLEVAYQ
ncbi:hypothetical protein [Litchfieldia alkalitelluris]|uniref:hypothetical protein n=1 Tax=Litchfieldia alkalitelluris TaxID=304268 RepID=UPI000996866E|nr:hypothetical protein [Litchfieldia alkalitelluris]